MLPKEIRIKVLSCYGKLKPFSVSRILGVKYHIVPAIFRRLDDKTVVKSNHRKYPYIKK